MAISNFSLIVSKNSAGKEIKVYNPEPKVRMIEKDLNDGKIDLSQAMIKLRSIYRYELSDNDYRNIQKEAGYNVK